MRERFQGLSVCQIESTDDGFCLLNFVDILSKKLKFIESELDNKCTESISIFELNLNQLNVVNRMTTPFKHALKNRQQIKNLPHDLKL